MKSESLAEFMLSLLHLDDEVITMRQPRLLIHRNGNGNSSTPDVEGDSKVKGRGAPNNTEASRITQTVGYLYLCPLSDRTVK